jgi:hypothetical protein
MARLLETRVKDAQRAMATAMIYPEPEKAHHGKKSDQAKKVFATKTLAPRVFRWPAPCSCTRRRSHWH